MAEASAPASAPVLTEPQARHVIYCGVCSLPPEVSPPFSTSLDLSIALLQEALQASLSTLSLDAQKRAAKDAAKKEAKAALAEARTAEKIASSKVLIKRVERNKRKYVTCVSGLEAFGLDLKKVSKDFGKRFATGSSVTKVPSGGEEIVVQGDLSDEIFDYVVEEYEGVVPEDNVECVEDKKKKG
ncbi:MAG: Translation machinery-associated protein 22 [Icmadophila ericetorum]|nr:Translation machinery-associated protein 22 [Icmadophila ericetorum]